MNTTPIDIAETPISFKAPKELNVVTTGAHLLIDVSKNVKTEELFQARKDTEKKYPEGCVKAKMFTTNNQEYAFSNQGILWSKGSVMISLSSTNKLNTELKFNKVIVSSCNLIKSAEIKWKNYVH